MRTYANAYYEALHQGLFEARALHDAGKYARGIEVMKESILVADGVVAGFVPGGRDWGTTGESSGWLVYLFAVVVLTVAARAVHGGSFAQRMLFALALIFFVERAFSPFALRVIDPIALGLHGLAALISLALAIATAAAIRGAGRPASSRRAFPAT